MNDSPKNHETIITDTCYGMTGGIRIDCSCGDYWVMSQPKKNETAELLRMKSTLAHIATTKKPAIKPD